jgi:hypothetical protein
MFRSVTETGTGSLRNEGCERNRNDIFGNNLLVGVNYYSILNI